MEAPGGLSTRLFDLRQKQPQRLRDSEKQRSREQKKRLGKFIYVQPVHTKSVTVNNANEIYSGAWGAMRGI